METETTTWSEFPKEAKATIKQTLGSEEKINPKEEDCDNHTVQESRKVNHLNKKALDKKNRIHLVYQSHQNKLAIAVGTKKNIGERVDWEYLTYVRWNSFKKWAQARGLWLIEEKRYIISSKASQKCI